MNCQWIAKFIFASGMAVLLNLLEFRLHWYSSVNAFTILYMIPWMFAHAWPLCSYKNLPRRDKYEKLLLQPFQLQSDFSGEHASYDASGPTCLLEGFLWNILEHRNQLLAALALLGISVWLFKTARFAWAWIITFIPALWMFVMSNWGLILLIKSNWFTGQEFTPNSNPVPIISLILLLLSIFMAAEVAYTMVRGRKKDSIVVVGE